MTTLIVKYLIVAWIAYSVLVVVAAVGKPRQPITGTTAVLSVLIYGAIIAAILAGWLA